MTYQRIISFIIADVRQDRRRFINGGQSRRDQMKVTAVKNHSNHKNQTNSSVFYDIYLNP